MTGPRPITPDPPAPAAPPMDPAAGLSRWRLGRVRLTTLVFAVMTVLVLALVVTAAASGIARFRNAAAQEALQTQLLPAQLAAKDLTKAYLDLETAERGYLLTGDTSFLAPFDVGRVEQLQARLDRLLPPGDRSARRALARVAASGDHWVTHTAEPAITARKAGPLTPRQIEALLSHGEAEFDVLRARLTAVEEGTRELTADELDLISFRQTVANVVAALAVLVALLAVVFWVPVLRRLLVRPLSALEDQVQAVADGDYGRTIEANGPAEIGTIATAVDSMRASIVASSQELVATQHELTLRDERERMAADLHDLTIQRVFALGLALSSTAVRQPRLAPLLEPLIEETDDIIRELRGVIFGIRSDAAEGTLRHRVGALVQDSSRGLGFTPALKFTGPVDSACDEQLAGEVVAVLREALSNVARHAHATRASIRVAVDGHGLTVAVSDDGVGLGGGRHAGHGLGNLRLRAVRLGGDVTVTSPPGSGTALTWQVPLAPTDHAATGQLEA